MTDKNADDNQGIRPVIKKRKIGVSSEEKAENQAPSEAKKVETISTRKVLFVEIDEEIITICDRIKRLPHKNVYIVVPQRSLLFQSIVNLKILKRKALDFGKNAYIITNDPNGIHMSQLVGLTVYDRVESEDHPHLVSSKSDDDGKENQLKITPLTASVNSLEDETPLRLKMKKMTIQDIVKKLKKKKVSILPAKMLLHSQKPVGEKKRKESRLVLVTPNRQAVISLVVVSLLLLLTITYIALPSATIYLTPKSEVPESPVNVTLADKERNQIELDTHQPNMIASYPVRATIPRRVTHFPTGKEFKGENARGKVTVINKSPNDWPLVANTRFQTSEGIVFRSQGFVTVPAARGLEAGQAVIDVTADEFDVYEQVVGDRGNIGPSSFFLPGLNAANQKMLFAESKDPMTGGKTNVTKYITPEDVEAAKGKLIRELEGEIETALNSQLKKQNETQNLDLRLLTGNGAYTKGEPRITIPDNLNGQRLPEFEIYGELDVTGTAYNYNEMLNILKTELTLKKNPQKRLVKIDTDSISSRIFDINAEEQKIKITAVIKGIEEFEIHPDQENGERLIEKIKTHILGKDIKETEQFIRNLPEINKVQIEKLANLVTYHAQCPGKY